MGSLLTDADETVHSIGTQPNWNESRYIDFWDAKQRVGGWFRIGNRPKEGRAEMSAWIKVSAAGDAGNTAPSAGSAFSSDAWACAGVACASAISSATTNAILRGSPHSASRRT